MRERMPGDAGLQALLAASEQRRAMCHLELHGEEEARELTEQLGPVAFEGEVPDDGLDHFFVEFDVPESDLPLLDLGHVTCRETSP